MTVPSVLYKYVAGATHHVSILRNLKIRFTQPDDLNDPHDGIPGLQPPDDIPAFVDAVIARSFADGRMPGLSLAEQEDARRRTIAQYQADPDKLVARLAEAVKGTMNKVGVLSLAQSNAIMPMWAHYGNGYRGFVIGFRSDRAPLTKRSGELASEGVLSAVRYVSSPVVVPLADFQLPIDFYFTKTEAWKYEEEWRIIRRLTNCDSALPDTHGVPRYHLCEIDPDAIVRVDIGYEAPDSTIEEIRKLTGPSTSLAHVEVYRAQMNASRTMLTFAPL
jgi:hypothetical protein